MEKENSPLLEKQYHIPLELFRKAFKAFQYKYVYPKVWLLTGILLVIAGIYSYFVVQGTDSQRPVYCMIVVFCIVMCALQWYNPQKVRRNLMEGIREIEEDAYKLRVFGDYMEIGTILPEETPLTEEEKAADALFADSPEENFSGTRIFYTKDIPVLEYPDFFMVYLKKRTFYVVPKKEFSSEEQEILRGIFREKLGRSFIQKL